MLHSAIVVEKRDSLLAWTILLAILTFALSLIGTFLVRSGILSFRARLCERPRAWRVHSADPGRGGYQRVNLVRLACAETVRGWLLRLVFSREGGLLANNILLCVCDHDRPLSARFILWYWSWSTGDKITVGPPYFNKAFLPVFGLAVLGAGIGPLLAWKRANRDQVRRNLIRIVMSTALVGVALIAGFGWPGWPSAFGIAAALFLGLATLLDLARRIGIGKATFPTALHRLVGLPRSAWGLYLGHLGMSVAAAGVVAAGLWKVEEIQVVQLGEPAQVGAYTFTLHEVENGLGPNYQTSKARVTVERQNNLITTLYPERRWYPVERQPTTEAGIDTHWHGDFLCGAGRPQSGRWIRDQILLQPGGAVDVAWRVVDDHCRTRLIGRPAASCWRALCPPQANRSASGVMEMTRYLILILMFLALPAYALNPGEMFEDPAKEERAREIGRQLRCLVCQNQSIFDSNAGLAYDLRVLVRERIAAGDGNGDVLNYISERYGDYVLLEPKMDTKNAVLWATPILALILSMGIAFGYLRRRKRAPGVGLSDQDRKAAQQLLKGDPS